MSITPPGSMTAANCTACSWLANTARSAGTAVVAGATKVSNLVASAFRALAHYTAVAFGYVKHAGVAALNSMKAHPQVAAGGLALVVLAAAAYAYKAQAANA